MWLDEDDGDRVMTDPRADDKSPGDAEDPVARQPKTPVAEPGRPARSLKARSSRQSPPD